MVGLGAVVAWRETSEPVNSAFSGAPEGALAPTDRVTDAGAALRQLEQLLNEQERQRNDVGAARTLESMIRLAPGNLSLRNRLVEAYLRRGRIDEAIDQLIIQGRIFQQARRIRDAFVPMRRGVEIATMMRPMAAALPHWASATAAKT